MTQTHQTYPVMDATSVLSLGALQDLLADPRSESAATLVESLPPYLAVLLVREGGHTGAQFMLDRDLTTAGRHPDGEIFLDDVTVSRRHAEFRRDAYGVKVRDVGSLNGTYVNRDRIDEVQLNSGDEVQIGKYRLVYYASGQA